MGRAAQPVAALPRRWGRLGLAFVLGQSSNRSFRSFRVSPKLISDYGRLMTAARMIRRALPGNEHDVR